jgi:hypothetical protein
MTMWTRILLPTTLATAGLMLSPALRPLLEHPCREPWPYWAGVACAAPFGAEPAPAASDALLVETGSASRSGPVAPDATTPSGAQHNNTTGDSPPAAPTTQPAVDPEQTGVIELLDTLERSAADLESFTADIRYQVEDELLGDTTLRTGSIIYTVDPESKDKRFAILFDSVINNRRKREEARHFIFDQRWLTEIDWDRKLYSRYEIVAPGKRFDPFKLGEGPIPLPIGQSRDEVLERFDATLISAPETGLIRAEKIGADVDGLRLVPKPDTPLSEEIRHVDLFYDRQTRLPVGVTLLETKGKRKTARLDNLRRNPELSEAEQARLTVPDPDPTEWTITIERLGER